MLFRILPQYALKFKAMYAVVDDEDAMRNAVVVFVAHDNMLLISINTTFDTCQDE